jgi:hypothetical protein
MKNFLWFCCPFSCFCNWKILVVDIWVVDGGLPVLPGTASWYEVASVPGASVSMSAAFVWSVAYLFRLCTSWKPSSCVVCCPVVFGRLIWSSWRLLLPRVGGSGISLIAFLLLAHSYIVKLLLLVSLCGCGWLYFSPASLWAPVSCLR